MPTLKILILLVYYDRPNLIKNALNSIKNSTYHNWELAFIDDGSPNYPGQPIVEEMFTEKELEKTTFYICKDTPEQKDLQGGSRMGHYMNQAIEDALNTDIVVILCDDDALHEQYLGKLNDYFLNNPTVNYAYSHVIKFNPETEKFPLDMTIDRKWMLNRHTQPINPHCQVDASQVAWRYRAHEESNISFPSPRTAALDAELYTQLYNTYGPCPFTGFISQYKGVFENQLGTRMAKGQTYLTNDRK